MSEEEKKAVECLKKQYKQSAEKKDATLTIYLVKAKRILELIEKQQKEIEELKKPRYVYNAETNEIKEIEKENCISKDKIREKLTELEEVGHMLADEQGYWGSPKLLNQMEILEELLEEN